jgi:hypothetical protein
VIVWRGWCDRQQKTARSKIDPHSFYHGRCRNIGKYPKRRHDGGSERFGHHRRFRCGDVAAHLGGYRVDRLVYVEIQHPWQIWISKIKREIHEHSESEDAPHGANYSAGPNNGQGYVCDGRSQLMIRA